MKRTSIAQVTRAGYRALAPYTRTLATYEGFAAQANAVSPLREKSANSLS
jgi:histidinol dehydrogenase